MTRVLAPASTANLGPGFDAAAAALDLWNELVVEPGPFDVRIEGEGAEELPRDASHLALRAFALFAPVEDHRFSFVNRIPLERGLGSSAAAIALGLVAGAAVAHRDTTPSDLLAAGVNLEGHADNLAAALYGGVTLAWEGSRAARIADTMPLTPVLVVPDARTNTADSRSGLPREVAHADAAATAGAAALLGAAIAGGDPALLRLAFRDRLHEPFRASPLFTALRERYGAVTLSGSGPSVVVWTENGTVVEAEGAQVLPLTIANRGAHVA